MKKLIISVLLLVAAAATSFAQLHIGFGYLGEYNSVKNSIANTLPTAMHGAYIGASYNICFKGEDGPGIAPGAYFKFTGDLSDHLFTHHTSVEVPVYFSWSFNAGPGLLFAYAGPAFNVGITCKQKWVGEGESLVDPWDMYHKDTGELSRFDLKVGLGLGYNWEHLAVNFGWDFGCLNQYRKDLRDLNPDAKCRVHSWHAGIAYVF